ncbi:MAG: phosphoribosylanthranilate isomerase [Lachnospiraceae bacterium]|nr:phosphoribosylanthranilate isomerase [Lachnospiraceae bacterium]
MTRECDIAYANEAQPDYAGFVFAGTKRKISRDMAVRFRKKLSDKIKAVGVFVDEDVTVVSDMLNEGIINIAQLHGSEDNDYILKLKRMTGCEVIKAVRVAAKEDITRAHKLEADYLLFDAYIEGTYGGTGETFRWDIVDSAYRAIQMEEQKPFFLAGGIHAENVCGAAALSPYGIDISTGIETGGYKDRDKMIDIVRRIRDV